MSEPMKWFLVWAMILFRNRKSFCFKSKPHPGGIFNFLRQGLIETIRKDQRKIIMDILASYASLEFIVFVIFLSHFPSHIYSYAFHFNGIERYWKRIGDQLLLVVFNNFSIIVYIFFLFTDGANGNKPCWGLYGQHLYAGESEALIPNYMNC